METRLTTAVLVTGATGLIGSNVCKVLCAAGRQVRALVRPGSEMGPLAVLGVELVEGDITRLADVRRAAEGMGAIVNSAALLGGSAQEFLRQEACNHLGSVYCYDVASELGARVVEMTTTTFFRHEQPLTERPEALPESEAASDPYTVTKGRAYREGLRRASAGQDVLFVVPGGTFGPAPTPGRALAPTSYNRIIRAAIRGRLSSYVSFPVPWVRAEDVAQAVVSAIDHGEPGVTYLAFGAEDAQTTASFLNVACEVAGVEHRVGERVVETYDPALAEVFGPTLLDLAQRSWPVPWFDNSHTREQLDYRPLPLRESMEETVDWMREKRLLDSG
jgi:dihydroflavonol-4-reductase